MSFATQHYSFLAECVVGQAGEQKRVDCLLAGAKKQIQYTNGEESNVAQRAHFIA